MREILFRGKSVNDGRWVFGDLSNYGDYRAITTTRGFSIIDSCEVIPETVGQYTGLKDLHGTKIFAGDIIQSIESGETGEIQYFPEHTAFLIFVRCSVMDSRCYLDYLGEVKPSILKVIGNVYDNQEILKGEREKI